MFVLTGHTHKVTFTGVAWDAAGSYKAVATNEHGTAEITTRVKVTTKIEGQFRSHKTSQRSMLTNSC